MEELLIYLLKSAGLLSIFFLAYQLLLRNDTSFRVNRGFLFWGIVASLLLPAAEFTRVVLVENTTAAFSFASIADASSLPPAQEQNLDWWQLAGIVYFLGLAIFLTRFLVQLFSLRKLLRKGNIKPDGRHVVIFSEKNLAPFSFFRYIVISPGLHSEEELQIILKHEKVHASQWHSADVLLANLTSALLWFHPISWWYKKSLIQNLEYIADKETVAAAVPKKEYQQTLVKISMPEYQPALANNFYQSLIKKRIIMLNKKPTRNLSFLKIGSILPFLIAFTFFFNVKTEAQVKPTAVVSSVTFKDDSKLSTIINKYTQQETLDAVVAMFKEEGVDLKFDNLEYSDKGLLTRINVSIVKKDANLTGTSHFQNSEGIEDFRIAMDENSVTIEPVAALNSSKSIWDSVGEKPFYIINDKEYKTSDLVGKTIWIKGGMSLLPEEEASEKYGENAKDRVIVIREGEIIEDFNKELEKIDSGAASLTRRYISVVKGEKPRPVVVESQSESFSRSSTGIIPEAQNIIASQSHLQGVRIYTQDSTQKRPLIIINGDIKEKSFDVNSIDPNTIGSVQVFKDEDGIRKYGEKAKNGVIVISLKGNGSDNGSGNQVNFHYEAQEIRVNQDSDSTSGTIKILGVSNAQFDNSSGQLYVLNGKILDSAPGNIDPATIEHINILKGDAAVKKYGKKAEKGVIEITLKKNE